MTTFIQPKKIIVNSSSIQGNGVFATEDISAGELIERCPMVRLTWRSNYIQEPTIWKYCYTQPKCDCSDCKNHGFYFWMVLGYGMIYNHQDDPNTKWEFNYDEAYADVIALSDIKKNQEIFVTYGSSYFRNKPKVTLNAHKEFVIPEVDADDDEVFMSKIKELIDNPPNVPSK